MKFSVPVFDKMENITEAGAGHSHKKISCIAFDLAFLRSYLFQCFPHFVFHDGVFESLDNRKKEKLLDVYRQYGEMGIQSIITMIDSDIPDSFKNKDSFFKENEVILTLHDEGDRGRLFKMPPW